MDEADSVPVMDWRCWFDASMCPAEAFGKNLVLRFEGGVVLRSQLRMTGRWQVVSRSTRG